MVNVDLIKRLLDKHFKISGTIKVNPETGAVDVQGDVQLVPKPEDLTQLAKLPVEFGHVSGHFDCSSTRLKSLEGAARSVGGSFLCYNNDLRTLVGAPVSVGGDCLCSNNRLGSLRGAPTSVKGEFTCFRNLLKDLTYAPTSVGGSFRCGWNQLTSLQGAPNHVGGHFDCANNPLTDLIHLPDQIPGKIVLTYNTHLPLLRCLVAHEGVRSLEAPPKVMDILNDPKYMGKGKAASLACAALLIRAGYRDNARWD